MKTKNYFKDRAPMKGLMKTMGIIMLLFIVTGNNGNAQSRDNYLSQNIIGTWQTTLYVNGITTDIAVTYLEGGRMSYVFTNTFGNRQSITGNWMIQDGFLYEKTSSGGVACGIPLFTSGNTMNITIVNNGDPLQAGIVRTFKRTSNNPSFTGQKYDCERCLCRRYEKKSTFNSDCKNCGHPKGWHYSQK